MFALFEKASERKLDGKCDHNLPAFLETPMVLLVFFFFQVKSFNKYILLQKVKCTEVVHKHGVQRFLCFK